ncbi:MAG: branched-chain amino acid ABC transporter permease [Chloroflexi bacterium]|nr:branched-chain amino acid ABC transporter permease [Chloroflexota bacterium]
MKRRFTIPTWIPTLVFAAAIYLAVRYATQTETITRYWYQVIQFAAITAISALGLNLIYGFNGQFSLGHVGFYAIGAYGSALITKDFGRNPWSGDRVGALSWIIAAQLGILLVLAAFRYLRIGRLRQRVRSTLASSLQPHECNVICLLLTLAITALILAAGYYATIGLHWVAYRLNTALYAALPQKLGVAVNFAVAILSGGTMAALVSYLVGLPLLRLGSDYFGIATLGFAIMMYTALQNSDLVIETMKGARGMVGIPPYTTWTWAFGALVVCAIIMRNLIRSSQGRAIISVREDEIAARAMGINVAQQKAMAFSFGGFFAGIAGALFAHLYGFLHPSSFNMIKGFDPLIIIVFGGLGSMTGTIVASIGFALLIEGLRVILPQGFEDWRFVIYPILLLLVMLLRQEGLLGTREWGWLRAPLPPDRDIPVPPRALAAQRAGGNNSEEA